MIWLHALFQQTGQKNEGVVFVRFVHYVISARASLIVCTR